MGSGLLWDRRRGKLAAAGECEQRLDCKTGGSRKQRVDDELVSDFSVRMEKDKS